METLPPTQLKIGLGLGEEVQETLAHDADQFHRRLAQIREFDARAEQLALERVRGHRAVYRQLIAENVRTRSQPKFEPMQSTFDDQIHLPQTWRKFSLTSVKLDESNRAQLHLRKKTKGDEARQAKVTTRTLAAQQRATPQLASQMGRQSVSAGSVVSRSEPTLHRCQWRTVIAPEEYPFTLAKGRDFGFSNQQPASTLYAYKKKKPPPLGKICIFAATTSRMTGSRSKGTLPKRVGAYVFADHHGATRCGSSSTDSLQPSVAVAGAYGSIRNSL
mmetsp:Transcript_26008/g.42937  ORF Transcript_26008/g.42937 Transcript_26008/m.42937 type:complete len:275 (-) Transcript_26008:58-882(-)